MNMAARLDRHFLGMAAVAALTGAGAEAAIVYSGVVNINIPSTLQGVYLNVVTGTNNSVPGNVPGWDVDPWSSAGFGLFNPAAPTGGVYINTTAGGTVAINMAPGAMINSSNFYGSNTSTNTSQWVLNSSNNLVGFRFQNENNANAIHYGWMRISFSGGIATQPRSIVEYAYEDQAGAGIPAGAIGGSACYPNCDASTTCPVVNTGDFTCFLQQFSTAAQLPAPQKQSHYANCDASTTFPQVNTGD